MHRFFISGLTLTFVLAIGASAQSFDVGADVVSRYIWRGADFGESASIQPAISFSYGGFEIGSWASYATNPASAGVNEHDLWVSYTVGNVSIGVTDYHFPNDGPGFFNFDNGGEGAHFIEPFLAVTGPATFPVEVFAGIFAYNDPDHSLFLSASYPFSIDGVDLAFTTSASGGKSALYGTDKFGIVELNLTASKSIPITDSFSLPISVGYILNPYAERSFLVFGVSFF